MEAFDMELVKRLPLAQATLELFDFVLERQWLDQLYERSRGHCYTAELTFPAFVGLLRDCLLVHGGSGHKGVVAAEQAGTMPVAQSSFYRKLSRMPVEVSQALLRECTARLHELVPPAQRRVLPACVDNFEVYNGDGKKLKKAAKRLKPCRGFGGKLLGAKVLVAMDARTGLAVAMNSALDGEANDVPLVPGLLPQARVMTDRPILWVMDRQFGDLQTVRKLAGERDHFLVRIRSNLSFTADDKAPRKGGADQKGRRFIDECGWLGGAANRDRLYVRRITLELEEGEQLVLITDLTDRAVYLARDLLEVYRGRWKIEEMFQQVSEVFELRKLIGCTPQAALFQAAFCLLMYNLIQTLRGYAAQDGNVKREEVSTHNLFYDVKRALICWAYLDAPVIRSPARDAPSMRRHLGELLSGNWREAWIKASDKKPRKKRLKEKVLNGGHTSVWRLLQAAAEASA
jgi:hypothetical protein